MSLPPPYIQPVQMAIMNWESNIFLSGKLERYSIDIFFNDKLISKSVEAYCHHKVSNEFKA